MEGSHRSGERGKRRKKRRNWDAEQEGAELPEEAGDWGSGNQTEEDSVGGESRGGAGC